MADIVDISFVFYYRDRTADSRRMLPRIMPKRLRCANRLTEDSPPPLEVRLLIIKAGDGVEGIDSQECLSFDVLHRDETDEVRATVLRDFPVVPKDEKASLRDDGDRIDAVGIPDDIRLIEEDAIDDDVAACHFHTVARKADDPLDELTRGIPRVAEDDDIPAVRRAVGIRDLLDEDVLAGR